jgi:hypothetical protein
MTLLLEDPVVLGYPDMMFLNEGFEFVLHSLCARRRKEILAVTATSAMLMPYRLIEPQARHFDPAMEARPPTVALKSQRNATITPDFIHTSRTSHSACLN